VDDIKKTIECAFFNVKIPPDYAIIYDDKWNGRSINEVLQLEEKFVSSPSDFFYVLDLHSG
jgi:hypothetical protein